MKEANCHTLSWPLARMHLYSTSEHGTSTTPCVYFLLGAKMPSEALGDTKHPFSLHVLRGNLQ